MNRSSGTALRPVTPAGILAERLENFRGAVRSVQGVGPELRDELDEICALASGLDPYLERCTTPASEALRTLAARTEETDWTLQRGAAAHGLEAEMLSGHVEGQVLQFLVTMTGARRILEIGMFTGYSALAMAESLPADGRVVACEIDAEVASFARGCFDESAHGDKIDVMVGPASDSLGELAQRGDVFDLVFIDAEKAGYIDYLDAVLDGLLAFGGLVCVDNTLMQGQPYLDGERTVNGEAIRRFNERVASDPDLVQVLLPVRDGLTLIRRV